MTTAEADAVRVALATTGSYVAVGRLTVSTIYDGERMPELFRLQDPGSGRTMPFRANSANNA